MSDDNIKIVMGVIHGYFKKAKGPKEIMEEDQEGDMAWKKKPEIKKDLDDIVNITKFDYALMQSLI